MRCWALVNFYMKFLFLFYLDGQDLDPRLHRWICPSFSVSLWMCETFPVQLDPIRSSFWLTINQRIYKTTLTNYHDIYMKYATVIP
jgi:hypothetical protein